jgi:hypothetical protein
MRLSLDAEVSLTNAVTRALRLEMTDHSNVVIMIGSLIVIDIHNRGSATAIL